MLKELGRLLTSQTSRQAAKAALPGAALNFAVGTMAGGPAAGAAYAAGDFLLNYPLVGATRKMFPGTPGGMATIKGKDGVVTKREIPYSPSSVETGVNLIASLASMPLVDYVTQGALYQQQQQLQPAQQSQERQINQQVAQRQRVNNLINAQPLSPGTQFQEFHYPGITLPPETLELLQSMQ
jgi:hypothetical protein